MRLKTRIFLAFVVGLTLVGAVLWWNLKYATEDGAASISLLPESGTRTFIGVSDTNQDGIPDWKEALAAEQSVSLDTISTSTPYDPETKTGKVLKSITEKYLETKATNGDVSYDLAGLLSAAENDLASSSMSQIYQMSDFNLTNRSDETTLRQYGNEVVNAVIDHPLPTGTRNELEILSDALINDDETILKELDPIIYSYQATIADMLLMPVPEVMANEHLALTNVYQALLEDIQAFRAVFTDAVPSLLRTRRYPTDNVALYTTITNVYEKLDRLGIKWSSEGTVQKLIKVE